MKVFINDYSLLALLNLIQESPPDSGRERRPIWLKSRIFLIKSDGKTKVDILLLRGELLRNLDKIYISFVQSGKREPNSGVETAFNRPLVWRRWDRFDEVQHSQCARGTVPHSLWTQGKARAEIDVILGWLVFGSVYVSDHLCVRVCTGANLLACMCACAFKHMCVSARKKGTIRKQAVSPYVYLDFEIS